MRRLSMLVAVAVFVMMTAPLFGGENAELRKQLTDVNKEINTAKEKALKENAVVKKLNDAVVAAGKAVQKAYADIPEIKAVDDKLTESRTEMGKLQKERMDAMKKAGEVDAVKTAKKAVEDAQTALKNDPKNADLQKALKDAQAALQKALSEVPEVKAVDDKMAEPKKKMEDLNKEREGLRKKNAENEAVKAALQAQTDAKAALDKAIAELPGMKELTDKKADLEKQLKPAPKPKVETPKVAPRVRRPVGPAGGGNGQM